MKKVKKYIRKAFRKKKIRKYFRKAWKELKEEAEDFFEDFYKKKTLSKKLRQVNWFGTTVLVRPAYLFAERIESLLKIIFGISIFVSAIIATFFGFASTSQILKQLIVSIPGRIILIFIGFSYFIIGLWKLLKLPK